MGNNTFKQIENNPNFFNHEPKTDLWPRIDDKINKKVSSKFSIKPIIVIAATLIIGVVIITNYNTMNEIDFHLSYESSDQIENLTSPNLDATFKDLISFNKNMEIDKIYSRIN